MVRGVVVGYIVDNYCLRFGREAVRVDMIGYYIVGHFCLMYEIGAIHVDLVDHNFCLGLTDKMFMLLWLWTITV